MATMAIKRFEVGQKASVTKTITEADVLGFARVSGDYNPVHLDEEYARSTRFGGRIAHGMLTASLISAVLGGRLPGLGTIYLKQTVSFLAPVYLGDTITAEVEITRVREDKPILTLRTICYNQRGERVVDGEAMVLAPSRSPAGQGGPEGEPAASPTDPT